ncbi:hypothetical protein GOBAR_AA22630 [Gossypium barbadense]|uniref:Uncharacterized protein n=1 Tax=Gossypium barbadense TaxID=3634 RepID=A0A2P5X3W2_GOSBA|nr:hypothetical protein GOBAR_AA22630 [Gossypium barbadense]
MFNTSNAHTGTPSSYWGRPNISDFGIDIRFRRMNDILLTTSTNKGTSNPRLVIEVDNKEGQENEEGFETNNDPIEELGLDALGIARWDYLGFTTYEPLPHMHTINLATEGGLEFQNLLHRKLGQANSIKKFNDSEVRIEYNLKDGFVAAIKQYNVQLGINFTVTCS